MSKQSLATLIRPSSLKDVIGQTKLLDELGLLTRMVATKKVFSLIFYGNPGVGKTTLACALANELEIPHSVFNASIDNKSKLMGIIDSAKLSTSYIIIIEEIHRMNADKQDVLLSLLENENIYMFATTTENPFFVLNPALRSRANIIQVEPVNHHEMVQGLQKICAQYCPDLKLENDHIFDTIANSANGDVRAALNILDILNDLYQDMTITQAIVQRACMQAFFVGSYDNDEFHDLKSALHKSIRGSDVDASLYYLARLIKIGDLKTICRRLLCVVYEDIGLANSALCMKVVLACDAAQQVGFPECHKMLAQVVIEMCLSPKSCSANNAIDKALATIETGGVYSIPYHLRDGHYQSAAKLGVTGYVNPHEHPNHWVDQQYLPDELLDTKFYFPDQTNLNESKMNQYAQTNHQVKHSPSKNK